MSTEASKLVHFVGGWWHAHDLASASEVLDAALRALGLDRVPASALEAASRTISEEAEARRHQIGIAARHANAQLARLDRTLRVRAFRESAEWATDSDEPIWLVVEPDEHARLLEAIGAPEGLERAYDDPSLDPDPLTSKRARGPRIPANPAELFLFARQQVDARNYALALEAVERWLGLGYAGDDAVLVELMKISTLRALSRHADAIAAWHATAASWIAGRRRVWRSQWVSLAKLHAKLKMPKGPELLAIEELAKTAPQ